MRGRALAVIVPAAALALAIGLFLLRTRQLAGTTGLLAFPLDDSWIHLHFARNLAEGRGFAYNPGVPVSGSTAPLWTLLLAGVFAGLGSHPALAKVLGTAATLGSAWVAGRLAATWTGCRSSVPPDGARWRPQCPTRRRSQAPNDPRSCPALLAPAADKTTLSPRANPI